MPNLLPIFLTTTLWFSYSERQQRTKVNSLSCTYSDILYGVRQGSILGPLLFNINISNMFYDIDHGDIDGYAHENTPSTSDFKLEEVIQKLELITNYLFEWLKNNYMKANADKCHLLVTRDTDVIAKVGKFDVRNNRKEKLGIKIDTKAFFGKSCFFPLEKSKLKVTCTRKSHKFYGSS